MTYTKCYKACIAIAISPIISTYFKSNNISPIKPRTKPKIINTLNIVIFLESYVATNATTTNNKEILNLINNSFKSYFWHLEIKYQTNNTKAMPIMIKQAIILSTPMKLKSNS